jgi:hypothetical protein
MNELHELDDLEAKARRVYGPARLSGGTRLVLWLLRVYVVGMLAVVVAGFAHQLR